MLRMSGVLPPLGTGLPGNLRDRWRGSRNWVSSPECGGLLGRPSLLGILEDLLRKTRDTGICHYRDPFKTEGNLASGGRLVYRGL